MLSLSLSLSLRVVSLFLSQSSGAVDNGNQTFVEVVFRVANVKGVEPFSRRFSASSTTAQVHMSLCLSVFLLRVLSLSRARSRACSLSLPHSITPQVHAYLVATMAASGMAGSYDMKESGFPPRLLMPSDKQTLADSVCLPLCVSVCVSLCLRLYVTYMFAGTGKHTRPCRERSFDAAGRSDCCAARKWHWCWRFCSYTGRESLQQFVYH